MASTIKVSVLGDAQGLNATMGQASKMIAKYGGDVEAASKAVVASAVQQREALQGLSAEYIKMAASAEKGSATQIESAKLAAASQKALRSELGATSTTVSKTSESFLSMNKIISGFIGFEVLKSGLEAFIGKAEAFNATTRQMNAQLVTNGESVKAIVPYVDELNARFEKLGFTNQETEQAFTRLDRASGSAAVAFNTIGLAADLAAAKHISFQQAALLVGKVIDGNTSALNRYGIAIPKGTSATDALAIATQKLAGQAQAAVTPQQALSAAVADLEAKIGNQLLPIVSHYIESLSQWLSSSQHQQQVTQLVQVAVHDLTVAIQGMVTAIQTISPMVQTFAQYANEVAGKLGGWNTVISELIITFAALRLAIIAVTVASDFDPIIAAVGALAIAAGYVITHWKEVQDFFDHLWLEITYNADLAWVDLEEGAVKAALKVVEPFSHLPSSLGGWARSAKDSLESELNSLSIQHEMDRLTLQAKVAGENSGIKFADGFAGALEKQLASGNISQFFNSLIASAGLPTIASGNQKGTGAVATPSSGKTYSANDIPAPLMSAINTAASKYGVPPDVLAGIWRIESGSTYPNPAVNSLGYGGLFGTKDAYGSTQSQANLSASILANLIKSTGSLSSALLKYSGGGYSSVPGQVSNVVAAGSLPPGSTALPNMKGPTKAKTKTPAIPDALQAEIDKYANAASDSAGATAIANLKAEEKLLEQAKGSLIKQKASATSIQQVQNQINDINKQIQDAEAAVMKQYSDDMKAAIAKGKQDAQSALNSFASGNNSAAVQALNTEEKDLEQAENDLSKLIAASSGKTKANYEKQLARINQQLAQIEKDKHIPEVIADETAKFATQLKTLETQNAALVNGSGTASLLQSVGYFKDTTETVSDFHVQIEKNLATQLSTLENEKTFLEGQLAGADPDMKAALHAKITKITADIKTLGGQVASSVGQVEQDLAAALQTAQGQFSSAVATLQTDLDNQLTSLAQAASGYTSDNAKLQQMQQEDQQKSLNDSLASATKQLAKDMIEGSGATQDQIDADQAAVVAAQRAIDENNLSIQTQKELTAANDAQTKQTADLNAKLADYEQQLLSGKITAAEFTADLASLQAEFGVTISDTVTPELVAVASAASGVTSAFNALISWVNAQTGSNIPLVGAGGTGGGASSSSNGGHLSTDVGFGSGYIPAGGFYSGGVVKAFGGMKLPGPTKAHDYIPVLANGGEMILNGSQQANLFDILNSGGSWKSGPFSSSKGGAGDVININLPNYMGDKRELVQILRTELSRLQRRN